MRKLNRNQAAAARGWYMPKGLYKRLWPTEYCAPDLFNRCLSEGLIIADACPPASKGYPFALASGEVPTWQVGEQLKQALDSIDRLRGLSYCGGRRLYGVDFGRDGDVP